MTVPWPGCLILLLAVSAARAADTGSLTGTLSDPRGVTAVVAVDRSGEKDRRYPGKVDPKTGKFVLSGLPLERTYDVVVDFGQARLEGVNLKVPPSDFEEEMPLSTEDVAAITKICKALNKFENEVEVLVVAGNCQHAAALLNKKRTTPFYGSKPGEMIWRLELWHFEKPEEIWLKSQEELGVIFYRQRLAKSDFAKKALTLEPRLGGVKLTAASPTVDLGKVLPPDGKVGIRLRK